MYGVCVDYFLGVGYDFDCDDCDEYHNDVYGDGGVYVYVHAYDECDENEMFQANRVYALGEILGIHPGRQGEGVQRTKWGSF